MPQLRDLIAEVHRRSLWQVLGIYVFGSWAAYEIIAEVTDRLGLPEWVPGMAIVLFLVGLPVVLATAFVQDGLPMRSSLPQGPTDPTLMPGSAGAPRAHPLTWKRAVVAGVTAFLLLGLTAGSYMGLRTAGVGPFASLLSRGDIEAQDRIVLARFAYASQDSLMADAVTEALRADLSQSRVVSVLPADYIGNALQRMDRPRSTVLDAQLAREVAVREGAKAVLEGEVTQAGAGYIITARLVQAGTGELLLTQRETAANDGEVIRAIDRLSSKLRGAIGESLRIVRADPPLDAVTTRSLVALRRYTQGTRAVDVDGDNERGIALLKEAIAEDSTFAMAWLKLWAVYQNTGGATDDVQRALTRAYELRDRLSERERLHTTAVHHLDVRGDPVAAAREYETLLESYPDDTQAMHRLAIAYFRVRDYDRSSQLYRRAMASDSFNYVRWTNLAIVEYGRGNRDEAVRLLDDATQRFPHQSASRAYRASLAHADGDYELAERLTLELLDANARSPVMRSGLNIGMSHLRLMQGRVREARAFAEAGRQAHHERGIPETDVLAELWTTDVEGTVERRPDAALRRLDAMTRSALWNELSPESRGLLETAVAYARYGNPARARELFAEWRTTTEAQLLVDPVLIAIVDGWIALAEDRAADAIASFRTVVSKSDCLTCGVWELGLAFDDAGVADSAIAYYRRFLETPHMLRLSRDALARPEAIERLTRLYAAAGDMTQATKYATMFAELWKDADPELRDRVQAVRAVAGRREGQR